mmetsp:Transcript_18302/g.37824  ORF Transcript_18302/g.37824 Transcript_18302/m.37824 type:complete len:270 (+) Transcript_18302:1288-2097(+)
MTTSSSNGSCSCFCSKNRPFQKFTTVSIQCFNIFACSSMDALAYFSLSICIITCSRLFPVWFGTKSALSVMAVLPVPPLNPASQVIRTSNGSGFETILFLPNNLQSDGLRSSVVLFIFFFTSKSRTTELICSDIDLLNSEDRRRRFFSSSAAAEEKEGGGGGGNGGRTWWCAGAASANEGSSNGIGSRLLSRKLTLRLVPPSAAPVLPIGFIFSGRGGLSNSDDSCFGIRDRSINLTTSSSGTGCQRRVASSLSSSSTSSSFPMPPILA